MSPTQNRTSDRSPRARIETTRLAARGLDPRPQSARPVAGRSRGRGRGRGRSARVALNPRRRSGRDFSHLARVYD